MALARRQCQLTTACDDEGQPHAGLDQVLGRDAALLVYLAHGKLRPFVTLGRRPVVPLKPRSFVECHAQAVQQHLTEPELGFGIAPLGLGFEIVVHRYGER